jgi:hypothetical protein
VTNGDVECIQVPSGLLRPLPLHVREHPERSKHVRVTLVRETLVALAPKRSKGILAEIRGVTTAAPLVDAIGGYTRAGDKAARALGLTHRRDLLVRDDGPLPLKHDVNHLIDLAKIEPALLTEWATATGFLHVALERSSYTASLRAAVAQVAPLAPYAAWLVPSLVRYAHVRIYEVLFGPSRPESAAYSRSATACRPSGRRRSWCRRPGARAACSTVRSRRVSILALGPVLYAAVLPPQVVLSSEEAVRYQIMASHYNPAHAALTMDLVAVPTLTGLPEATSTCSPVLTTSCRSH